MSDSDEQVVTVEVDVPADDVPADDTAADDETPDPAAQETAGDAEQQQDEAKHDSGSEDELETGGKKLAVGKQLEMRLVLVLTTQLLYFKCRKDQ